MTHLWTPWRSTYMQTGKEEQHCIFCDAASGDADEKTLVVYRGALCFIMLNRYPYTSGHLMIAPYEHVSRLARTSESATNEMTHLARRAEEILEADGSRSRGGNITFEQSALDQTVPAR